MIEQQDAVIVVLRELKDAEKKLAALGAEEARFGKTMSVDRRAALTNDIRATMQEVDRLRRQAAQLGLPDEHDIP